MAKGKYGIDFGELREAMWDFDSYMTASRWDECCSEGIYSDEGMYAIGCFVEFIETGRVTDEHGEEL